jgi:ubiquitin thioesterase protein OTUB1
MQMTALCRELKLNLDVAYLDGRKADNVDFVQFREGPENQAPLTVLYRYVNARVGILSFY